MDMTSKDFIRKLNELSTKMEDIARNYDDFTTSDLQSAIDAVLIEAIIWGKENK